MTPPLRIGVDARELLGSTTGVGRYLGELLRRWAVRPDRGDRRFLLYAPDRLPLHVPDAVEHRTVGSGTGTWWEQTALRRAVRADRPDVFFAPAYTAPLGIAVPLAVTIHDISFVARPEWFRTREGMRRRWLTGRAATTAAVVFTDSEFSRREIEQHLRVPKGKIRVIAPGVQPPGALDGSVEAAGASPPRAGGPYVLYVGSLFNRRRLPDLIASFARATEDMPRARLVIVGGDRTWPPQDLPGVALSYGLGERVVFKSYVNEDELRGLYAGASVFAFLSEYEGFGLTPLEALAAGVHPVVLDTPVAREVYRDAATYVDADDIEGTAAILRQHLAAPRRREDVIARAAPLLSDYSWDAAADRTLAEIEQVARR